MQTCYRCMRGNIVHGVCNFCGRSEDASNPKDDRLILRPGTLLAGGSVTVGALLGKGGFGATYVARSEEHGVIALKEFLPGSMVEPQRYGTKLTIVRGRESIFDYNKTAFEKEARLLSKLAHPNIIQVKLLFWENNTAYYGMELLEGSDLNTFIRARKGINLRAKDAANLIERLMPVLDALGYLHRRKVLHRDISPSNIYLRSWNLDKNSLGFNPCLIDFGAAFVAHTDYHKSLAKVKNPHYSPYEQNLSQDYLRPASDVYAFCATLYHALTGVAPQPAVDRMLSQDELVPPSRINPALRPLDDVLMQGMALRIDDRIQNVPELQTALENALNELRGGRKPVPDIDYDRDPVLGSVLALAFDILAPVSLMLIPILAGGMEWWMMALSYLWVFVLSLLLMLFADRTLGMIIFRVPFRGGGVGNKLLASLCRSTIPYAVVDMILFGCEVYPYPKCNGRPRSGRSFIPPPPPPPMAEFKIVANYNGPDGRPVMYPLHDRKVVRIGRNAGNDVVIPAKHASVSGHHLDVVCQDGSVYIADRSSNGTYVKQFRLEKNATYTWQEGDWIRLSRDLGFQLQRYH